VRCSHNSYTDKAEHPENISPGIDISLALSGFPFQPPFKGKPSLCWHSGEKSPWQRVSRGDDRREGCPEGMKRPVYLAPLSASTFTTFSFASRSNGGEEVFGMRRMASSPKPFLITLHVFC